MGSYVPPLRFHVLTPFYDRIVALTSAEARFRPALLELINPSAGALVVEIGCGTGTLTWQLARRYPAAKVVGIDLDQGALDLARGKWPGGGPAPTFQQTDARKLPFDDGVLDVAVTSLFFHHLLPDAKQAVLAEIGRVLRPGGALVIADWGRPHSRRAALAFLVVRLLDGFDVTREHTDDTFPDRVRTAGFGDLAEMAWFPAAVGTIRLWRATKA